MTDMEDLEERLAELEERVADLEEDMDDLLKKKGSGFSTKRTMSRKRGKGG